MENLEKRIKAVLCVMALTFSGSVLADDYCPQTIDCQVSGATANCNLTDGWVVGGVSYSGKTASQITLSFFSAQSMTEPPNGSNCNYYYSDPANSSNMYNIFIFNKKWFTPPLPAGVWQKGVDPTGQTYYWCYSPFVNPTTVIKNDSTGCPFSVIAPSNSR